jgi:hypothetical protein
MAKLGEILIRRGLLSEDVIGRAVETQIASGVRIGTELVQMNAVSLDEIGVCLSMQQGVPQATKQLLDATSDEALAATPAELCDEFKVFPLRLEGSTIHLAMRDPQRSVAGQIGFRLHLQVQPYIIPEIRLAYYLEHRFGIARDPRFLRAPDGGEKNPGRRKYIAANLEAEPPPAQLEMDSGLITLDQYDAPPAAPVARPMESVLARLKEAGSTQQIVDLLVEPALEQPSMLALFWIRNSFAIACAAFGRNVPLRTLQQLTISLETPSMLQFAFEQGPVRAQGQNDPLQLKIAQFLGWSRPGEVCVLPIAVRGRVINLLCVQLKEGATFSTSNLEDLRSLIEHSAAAYLRLVGKSRA